MQKQKLIPDDLIIKNQNTFPYKLLKPFNDNFQERYEATMVLASIGDAIGYKNGQWEFQKSSKIIHEQFNELTQKKGMNNFEINMGWRYSDDTAMHIGTALGLLYDVKQFDINVIGKNLAIEYVASFKNMTGRGPGKTTTKSISIVQTDLQNWNKIPFMDKAAGCGASMRSACIGLCFCDKIDQLIAVSIEAGRITHHNPTGYLGGFSAALFTQLAILDYKIETWPIILLQHKSRIKQYLIDSKREVQMNLPDKNSGKKNYFKDFFKQWVDYLTIRKFKVDNEKNEITYEFPKNYGVEERHDFYIKLNKKNGWGGSGGVDSVIIAYDAMLGCKNNWNELILRGVLHGGDNDSTGTICCAFYGATHGFKNVPEKNYICCEDYQKIRKLGTQLFHKYFVNNQKNQKEVQIKNDQNNTIPVSKI